MRIHPGEKESGGVTHGESEQDLLRVLLILTQEACVLPFFEATVTSYHTKGFHADSATMSSYNVKLRRVGGADYDTQIKEVRNQLAEQLRVVDSHLEQKSQVLQELSDYLRRRGEIESEYARSLDKLVDKFTSKSRKKESSSQSAVHCWHMLLSQTRQESKDHSALSDSCSTALPQDLSRCLEHVQRLAKKSKDICTQLQDGLLKVTVELQTTLKTYSQYHTEYLSAEVKLKEAAKQEEKQKQSAARKIERLIEKRQCKVQEIQLKCNKARNDYLLNLEAANASMNKYFLHDVSSLFDYSDAGFHQSLSQVLRLYMSRRSQSHHNLGSGLQQLAGALSGLDQNHDRDTLMQMHEATFCLPLRFQYQPHEGDQVCEVSADCEMKSELETRFQQLQTRLSLVTSENEELSNMVQVAHTAMLDCINEDVFGSTPEHITSQSPESTNEVSNNKFNQAKRRTNLQEVENSYFMKVKDYLLTGSLASKLQARHDLLKVAIQKAGTVDSHHPRKRSRKSVRQKKSQLSAQTSLSPFFGDLLSYIQASGEPIPVVVESCVRFINLSGLHHEGIFRVPGSQLEVNRLRDTFERGDDPLADETCDMDSVAGVLKLYFRGMENPLFPKDSFDQLMACGQTEDEMEKVAELKRVILSYPPPLIVVMRYLFAFLHHVSQYSDENMMQPYNLAVCFGPSLIRGPEDADAVALQQINAIVKTIITQHESIFPSQSELDGPVYETCMTLEQEDIEVAGEEGELESDASPHKEVKEELEGIALFDYTARSTAELSFKQGERVLLHSRASFDWWRGEVNGTKGLIPDKYISMPSAAGGQDHRDRERSSSGSQTVEQPAGVTHIRPRVSSEKSGVSASHVHAGKITLQIPTGQHMRQATSPGALRKPIGPQMRRSAVDSELGEEMKIEVDKDVCHQMNSVFKELLSRQQSGEQPEVSHSSSLPTETLSSSLPQNSQGRRGSAERKRRF
ncbi:rho GTPase-activating protein 4a isoform X1 [Electrophorus electricus]|nr:rho GTPase-activating protein 4a isoform X1 [Electrophorus electricus]